ncbi:MAG: phosphatidylglycerophosphatase A [Sedimentisphaerales bacterium]|nr:phosphatidylglycerophosphatase A [Sedimentisphaerales bacterium]
MDRMFTSCFGLGRLPIAPGTWGSIPTAAVFGLLCWLGTGAAVVSIVMAAFVVAGSVVCVKFAPAAIAATGKNDPREVVADEFAGQAVTLVSVPLAMGVGFSAGQIWAVAGIGFLIFRILDIAKPWPIRKLEKLPQGWGILADDLLAGVFGAVILHISLWLWLAR